MHEYILGTFNFILEVREKHYTFVRKGSNMIKVLFGGDHGGIWIGEGSRRKRHTCQKLGEASFRPGQQPQRPLCLLS